MKTEKTGAAPAPIQSAEVGELTTDEAREFLIGFMNEHFTDRTYHRYIRGQQSGTNLAGDFAWQMATALRRIGAAPCAMCHGTGSVGHAPDDYSDCPDCAATPAQPAADESAPDAVGFMLCEAVQTLDAIANGHQDSLEIARITRDKIDAFRLGPAADVSAPTDEQVTAALAAYNSAWTDHESWTVCKRNGIRAVLEFAARAAAPVSGQGAMTDKQLTELAMHTMDNATFGKGDDTTNIYQFSHANLKLFAEKVIDRPAPAAHSSAPSVTRAASNAVSAYYDEHCSAASLGNYMSDLRATLAAPTGESLPVQGVPGWRSNLDPARFETAFHAYHPSLVDPDFNPCGVVEACFNGEEFIGAIWNNTHDCWDTLPIEIAMWRKITGPAPTGASK